MRNASLLSKVFCLLLVFTGQHVFGSYSLTKFSNPNFCTSIFPTSYSTVNFSIAELSLSGKTGFKKSQNNKILILGFSNSVFQFNPGVGSVTATGSEVIINSYAISATGVTVNITTTGANLEYNSILFNNLQVRATAAGTGMLSRSGGGQSFLIDNSNAIPLSSVSWGDLTAGNPYSYSSNATTQLSTLNAFIGSTNNQIIKTQITIAGTCGTMLSATSFTFSTLGSGPASQNPLTNITTANLYYTNTSSLFSTATLFGSVSSPNGTFVINGNQSFPGAGTYNFWLTYDIASGANNNDQVDASFVAVSVAGTNYTATSGNPGGTRTINNNVFYSRDASAWSNVLTKWSTSPGGGICLCVPTGNSAVYISHATLLDVGSPGLAQVNIRSGGVLTDANKNLNTSDVLSTSGTGYFQATNNWNIHDLTTSGTGSSSINQAVNVTGDLNVGAATALQLTGAAGQNYNFQGNVTVNGVLGLGVANANISGPTGSLVAGTGSITGSGNIIFNQNKEITAGSTLNITPPITINGNIIVNNKGKVVAQNAVIGSNNNSAWYNWPGSVLNMSGSTSALLATGILSASAISNTVQYSGSGAQTIKIPVNSDYNTLILDNASTKTTGAALTIDASLIITGAAQFSSAANSVLLNGNWINNSSNASPFSSTGTVFFNGPNDSISGSGTTTFNHLDITATGFLVSHSSPGQVIVTGNWINDGDFDHNNADITFNGSSIISGGSVTTFNTVIVNSAKALTLHSVETDVEGDFTVNGTGTLSHNNGLLVFTGNGNVQNLNGNTSTITLYDAQLDNASGGLTLARPLTINDTLTLTNGPLITSSTNILTIISGATTNSGSATAFVVGPMDKTGTSAFIFPLGKGGRWAPIGISAPTASTTFRGEYFATPYTNTTLATTPSPTLHHVSSKEYWQFDRRIGTGNAALTLYWADAAWSGITNCSTNDLRVAHWNGSAWENNNESVVTGGDCVSGSNTGFIKTVSNVTSFSPFTFGSKAGSASVNPLPVELTNFNGDCAGDSIRFNWQTASERQNSYFLLESTMDGSEYRQIGKISAADKADGSAYYFSMASASYDQQYFRLSQVDKDGTKKMFHTIAIKCETLETKLDVFPNPATDAVNIRITSAETISGGSLTIQDCLGITRFERSLQEPKGSYVFSIDDLDAGTYVVQYKNAGKVFTSKLIVVR